LSIIASAVFRKQVRMVVAILTTITILSTYFIISYFLSIRTFNTASDSINSLEIIFQKGACYDYTFAFLRGSEIRNESIKIRSAS
jgi:hypothetical protein